MANENAAIKKILIVEDDSFISDMYKAKLEYLGYDIKIAENGKVGLELAASFNPNLILLDIVMPEKDGFELLSDLKKDEKLKNLPVILLTNLGRREDIEKGFKMGANDYIIKAHFTPQEVVDKVSKILKNQKNSSNTKE